MKKYIGYIRVSTDEQVAGFGLDAQKAAITSYASAVGYEIDKIISDEGFSGSNLERPGIQEVISLMSDCEYAGIIVYKLDRISRNLKDILIFHDDILNKCGSAIISVKEQFDTSTGIGRLMFQMIGGFAEFERTVIKERMMSGREAKAKQGKFAGGSAPYGYDLVNGELAINEYEADIVRKVFRMRSEGLVLRNIANNLNEQQCQTKRGGSWSAKHIKTMLDREDVYRGIYKHGDVAVQGQHKPILTGKEGETHEN